MPSSGIHDRTNPTMPITPPSRARAVTRWGSASGRRVGPRSDRYIIASLERHRIEVERERGSISCDYLHEAARRGGDRQPAISRWRVIDLR